MLRTVLPLLALVASLAPASAQVTPIAPFVGERFEGFETQSEQAGGQHPATGAFCLLGGLFDGEAALCTSASLPFVRVTGGSFAQCGSSHRTGSYYGGCLFSEFAIQFAAPQAAFGGYFVTDNGTTQNTATLQWEVRFVDSLGLGSASTAIQLPGCGAEAWFGWELPPGTVRIEFEPLAGSTLLFDDLMASPAAPLGRAYCAANETSIETRAYCAATGSGVAALNDLTLTASQLPPGVFGFFLASRDAGFTANPGGSAGNLCLGGTIGRFIDLGQIRVASPAGIIAIPVDLTAIPEGGAAAAVQAGETWRFQAWFRDVDTAGDPTSNFTAGLEVEFS